MFFLLPLDIEQFHHLREIRSFCCALKRYALVGKHPLFSPVLKHVRPDRQYNLGSYAAQRALCRLSVPPVWHGALLCGAVSRAALGVVVEVSWIVSELWPIWVHKSTPDTRHRGVVMKATAAWGSNKNWSSLGEDSVSCGTCLPHICLPGLGTEERI